MAGRLARRRRRTGSGAGIVRRVPDVGVDPVEDADQRLAAGAECPSSPNPSSGVVISSRSAATRRRSGRPVPGLPTADSCRPTTRSAVPSGRCVEPLRSGDPLVGEVVDRHHRRRRIVERGERGTGVPVVEVQHVGRIVIDQRRPRGRSGRSGRCCRANPRRRLAGTGADGRSRAPISRSAPPRGARRCARSPPTQSGTASERGLVDERDAVVVGHDDVDVDAEPAEFGTEPGRGGREAADRGHGENSAVAKTTRILPVCPTRARRPSNALDWTVPDGENGDQPNDALSDDIRLLGRLLGDVISERGRRDLPTGRTGASTVGEGRRTGVSTVDPLRTR